MGVIGHNYARFTRALLMEQFECPLAIVEGTDSVTDQNDVKRARQRRDYCRTLRIANIKMAIRVQKRGLIDHGRADIEPNAETRLQCRQQATRSAPDFENARPRRDEKAQVAQILAMKEGRPSSVLLPAWRQLLGIRKDGLLPRRQSFLSNAFTCCLPLRKTCRHRIHQAAPPSCARRDATTFGHAATIKKMNTRIS